MSVPQITPDLQEALLLSVSHNSDDTDAWCTRHYMKEKSANQKKLCSFCWSSSREQSYFLYMKETKWKTAKNQTMLQRARGAKKRLFLSRVPCVALVLLNKILLRWFVVLRWWVVLPGSFFMRIGPLSLSISPMSLRLCSTQTNSKEVRM